MDSSCFVALVACRLACIAKGITDSRKIEQEESFASQEVNDGTTGGQSKENLAVLRPCLSSCSKKVTVRTK